MPDSAMQKNVWEKGQSSVVSHDSRKERGFTLLEMMIVMAIMMVLAAITVPRFLNIVSDINLRYVATNYSGLLQSARIQSVRKNDYYGIQQTTLPTGDNAYFVHVHGSSYSVGDPLLPVGARIGIHAGTGSGAPGEATLTCGGSCTFATSSSFPYFNARGLPCTVSGSVCIQAPGVGYLTVLSTTSLTGNVSWAAVVVTGGGRIQIWSCDSAGHWVQRN
jgi:prepilin-type N-terminal cleavage/methylation domain-containing protein